MTLSSMRSMSHRLCYTDPERISGLLNEITSLLIAVGRRFRALSDDLSGGVTAIIRKTLPSCYLTSNCTVEMVSREFYERFLLPCDQRLADGLGCFGVHHCGATMEHVAEGYAKIRGLAFAEVGAFSDVAAVRAALPGIPLNARYSPVRLGTAPYDEMRQEIRAMAEAGRTADGALSVSCVGVDDTVSDERVARFLEACAAQSEFPDGWGGHE